MYTYLLYIHSWLRWAILLFAVANIYRSFVGWRGNKDFAQLDNTLAGSFIGSLHLMAIIGLTLYFFYSPFAFNAFGGDTPVMKNATLRFWSVEHIFAMVTAITLATIGRVRAKKAVDSSKKYKIQFIFFTLALLTILSAIPYESVRLFRW